LDLSQSRQHYLMVVYHYLVVGFGGSQGCFLGEAYSEEDLIVYFDQPMKQSFQ
jgi:hypothetical protein